MDYKIVELEERIVIGVKVEIKDVSPGMVDIFSGAWNKLYQGGVNANIKNKIDESAMGLYFDYKFNKPGYTDFSYNYIAGNEVSKSENPEYITKVIPKGKYAKFHVEGDMSAAVAEAWQEIRTLELDRSFICDFDHYLNNDFENAKVDIYVGIK